MTKLSPMKNARTQRFVNEEKASRKANKRARKEMIEAQRQAVSFQLEMM